MRQVTIFWGRRAKRFICISSREELINIKAAFRKIAGKKVVCKFDHDLFMHLELDSLKLQNIVQLILFNINQCVFYNNSVTMYMNTLYIKFLITYVNVMKEMPLVVTKISWDFPQTSTVVRRLQESLVARRLNRISPA